MCKMKLIIFLPEGVQTCHSNTMLLSYIDYFELKALRE